MGISKDLIRIHGDFWGPNGDLMEISCFFCEGGCLTVEFCVCFDFEIELRIADFLDFLQFGSIWHV